jgi:predicted ATPase with chaperone activity
VARTIADLNGAPDLVGEEHVATALRLRTSLASLRSGTP